MYTLINKFSGERVVVDGDSLKDFDRRVWEMEKLPPKNSKRALVIEDFRRKSDE